MKCLFCFKSIVFDEFISPNDRIDEKTNLVVADLIKIHFPFAEVIIIIKIRISNFNLV